MDERELQEMMGGRPRDSSRMPLINGDVSEVETSYISVIKKEINTENKISTSTAKKEQKISNEEREDKQSLDSTRQLILNYSNGKSEQILTV